MIKYSNLIGLEILSMEDGSKIGKVKDVIFSKNNIKIAAFVVQNGKLLKGKKVICLKKIYSIGKDAIIIKDKKGIEKIEDIPEMRKLFEKNMEIINKEIFTKSGECIGFVKDILFDTDTGKIKGFVITEGIIEDIMKGRSFLPFGEQIKMNEENIIIDDDFKEVLNKSKK